MAEDHVTVTLANPYEGQETGTEIVVSPRLAKALRKGGIAVPAEAALVERTVDELKDELRARDLPVSGTKAELISRLAEADEAAGAGA